MRSKEEITNKIKEIEKRIEKLDFKISKNEEHFEIIDSWIEKKWYLVSCKTTLRYTLGYNDLTIK